VARRSRRRQDEAEGDGLRARSSDHAEHHGRGTQGERSHGAASGAAGCERATRNAGARCTRADEPCADALRRSLLVAACLAACVVSSVEHAARADEPAATVAPAAPVAPVAPVASSAIPPPPPGFGSKQHLSDEDYAKKKEGGYFTGLPLANYDPNTGVGFGARAYYYFDGDRKNPLFAYTPYEERFFAQAFFTTNGLQFHWLDYDAPAIAGTPWRLRSQLIYERNTNRNYFGVDTRSQGSLSFPGDPRNFSSYDKYADAQSRVQPDGTTYGKYDKMFFERPIWVAGIERSLLGGLMRSIFGFQFSYARIQDYTGTMTDAKDASGADVKAPEAPTRLRLDCDGHRIVGCGGGWDNTLRVGLAFDTRDFEPDPNQGVFVDTEADFGTKALGSEYEYVRFMMAARGYYSPIPRIADLVLAARGVYEVQSQNAPFFSMDIFPFTEDPRTGMGGVRTLRGFEQDRFVGHVMAMSNFEIRWTFAQTRLLGQRFAFIGVPFLDMGRVFDSIRDTSFQHWNRAQGAGLRIAWNLATIIMVDYGVSEEDSGLYINFTHIF
jgi:hypothetical protein